MEDVKNSNMLSEDKMNIDPELKERIGQIVKGMAKIFANDVINGKKSLEEMIRDIENSEIPEPAKKWIVFIMGMEMPTMYVKVEE